MAGKKFYVVWIGRRPGIYNRWEDCRDQVQRFEGARYMSFETEADAREAMANGWKQAYAAHHQAVGLQGGQGAGASDALPAPGGGSPRMSSRPTGSFIAVDAACSGNPGRMEYRGVLVQAGRDGAPAQATTLFHKGPFEDGTNNIGEFLAIVHGLALQKQQKSRLPVYSDSANGLLWVKKKKCATKLAPTSRNAVLFNLMDKAEKWLCANTYDEIPLHKWQTEIWGEIPADFGRK